MAFEHGENSVPLDLKSLKNAIGQLASALDYCHSGQAKADPVLEIHLRAAVIQAFEFTYEISHKIMKRYLEATSANPAEIDKMHFQDIIRTAHERGFISGNWPEWKNFWEMRSKTSHTYDEGMALEVLAEIPVFQKEVQFLLEKLQGAQP